jgi:hypothetical protein
MELVLSAQTTKHLPTPLPMLPFKHNNDLPHISPQHTL